MSADVFDAMMLPLRPASAERADAAERRRHAHACAMPPITPLLIRRQRCYEMLSDDAAPAHAADDADAADAAFSPTMPTYAESADAATPAS